MLRGTFSDGIPINFFFLNREEKNNEKLQSLSSDIDKNIAD